LPDQLAYTLTRCKNVFFQMILYRMSKRRPAYIKAQLIKWTKHWLGDKVDVGKHFTPTYNPWDQRLCLVPDGDLFRSLRQGSSSVVTDHIKTFTDKGIELRSGETLEADIVVTATGLELLALGGMQVNVDGKEVDVSDAVQYKGMMLSDVPNLFFATGYTNASWTLKCDLTSGYVCRLIKHLDRHQQQICMPHNTDNHLKRIMSIGLESGYVMRSIDKFPKEGLTAPWKLYQNYFLDLLGLRMRSVKDGYMVFAKRGSIEE